MKTETYALCNYVCPFVCVCTSSDLVRKHGCNITSCARPLLTFPWGQESELLCMFMFVRTYTCIYPAYHTRTHINTHRAVMTRRTDKPGACRPNTLTQHRGKQERVFRTLCVCVCVKSLCFFIFFCPTKLSLCMTLLYILI